MHRIKRSKNGTETAALELRQPSDPISFPQAATIAGYINSACFAVNRTAFN